ncbi:Protein of unknown function (DUF1597) [Pseudomonas sp. GM21]|nr:Protein of unknown function (DUF1597) [Pseudomonas sp. GM21]
MHNIKVKTLGAVLAAFTTLNSHAAETPETGEGTLFRSLFGDTLEKDYGIQVTGLFDVAYSRNNQSTQNERQDGLSNLPVAGFADEGLEWGSLHLFVDKALKSDMVPRITPLPGPKPSEASFGFTIETNYGRNAQFARTYGWDMHWDVNSPGDDNLEKAKRDKQKFLAVPNIAATAYVPYGPGVTAMAGIFGPAIGYEIPPNIRAARNPFASKTYAFVSEPGTVAGVLLGTRLYNSESSIFGAELGVVQGWNNLRDNNDEKSLMGALRWRTADMQTSTPLERTHW